MWRVAVVTDVDFGERWRWSGVLSSMLDSAALAVAMVAAEEEAGDFIHEKARRFLCPFQSVGGFCLCWVNRLGR